MILPPPPQKTKTKHANIFSHTLDSQLEFMQLLPILRISNG